MLPYRLVPLLEVLAAPDVVDEYVQPPLLGADARHEIAHLVRDEVINAERKSATAQRRDQRGGFFDGLGPTIFRPLLARRSSRDVHRRTSRSQFRRDAPSRSSCSAGDERRFPHQFHFRFPTRSISASRSEGSAFPLLRSRRIAFSECLARNFLSDWDYVPARYRSTSSSVTPSSSPAVNAATVRCLPPSGAL
jgi:hypothetical protein